MKSFNSLPIRNKLTLLIMTSTLLGVLLISSIFVFQRYQSFKQQMTNEFTAIAKIISDRSNAAVLFEDAITLSETLASLSLHEQVSLACIYNNYNALLASYTRNSNAYNCPAQPRIDSHQFSRNYFHVSEPILSNFESSGLVYIQASTQQLDEEIKASLGSALTFSSLVIFGALLFARYVQRFISDPLIELQTIARKVTVERDFTPRAIRTNDDEIGELVDAFNTMLKTISNQNEVIAEHTDNLERKVEERTSELAIANRELEAFSYSVSHDLKAPLRKIDGFSRALEEDYAENLDELGLSYLSRLRANSQKMSQLITSLLQLSRVTRKELETEPFDLSELALNCLSVLREQDPLRKVDIAIQPGIQANGDQKLVEILLDNLLANAWKYSKNKDLTKIEIGVIRTSETEAFFVKDNGCGFNMEYADQLFKPFSRLHSPDEFEGTGIGLATTFRIIERHRGSIWAESEPGQGSTFYFTLTKPNEA